MSLPLPYTHGRRHDVVSSDQVLYQTPWAAVPTGFRLCQSFRGLCCFCIVFWALFRHRSSVSTHFLAESFARTLPYICNAIRWGEVCWAWGCCLASARQGKVEAKVQTSLSPLPPRLHAKIARLAGRSDAGSHNLHGVREHEHDGGAWLQALGPAVLRVPTQRLALHEGQHLRRHVAPAERQEPGRGCREAGGRHVAGAGMGRKSTAAQQMPAVTTMM